MHITHMLPRRFAVTPLSPSTLCPGAGFPLYHMRVCSAASLCKPGEIKCNSCRSAAAAVCARASHHPDLASSDPGSGCGPAACCPCHSLLVQQVTMLMAAPASWCPHPPQGHMVDAHQSVSPTSCVPAAAAGPAAMVIDCSQQHSDKAAARPAASR